MITLAAREDNLNALSKSLFFELELMKTDSIFHSVKASQ